MPKVIGELMSNSDVGRLGGDNNEIPGLEPSLRDWTRLLELGGVIEECLEWRRGEVTSEVWRMPPF